MLVKRKKKELLDKLEGLKFTHYSTNIVYEISKEPSETLFTVSWGKNKITAYSGSTKYSREDIVRNIQNKRWMIVF
jgi:hypothetical protein